MFYIGIFVRIVNPGEGSTVSAAGYIALACVFIFACVYQFGWGPVPWIYVSEIATGRLRATNVSYGAAMQWLFNFIISRAVPPMLETLGVGGYGTYMFFGCFCFSMAIFTWFFVPETKGLSLESMDELFGAQEALDEKKDVEHRD